MSTTPSIGDAGDVLVAAAAADELTRSPFEQAAVLVTPSTTSAALVGTDVITGTTG
jgi:hypothetical protein